MSDDPEEVAPDFAFSGEPHVEGGDEEELKEGFQARLDELEEVWPTLEEGDPQRPLVALEIVMLRRAIEHLEGKT